MTRGSVKATCPDAASSAPHGPAKSTPPWSRSTTGHSAPYASRDQGYGAGRSGSGAELACGPEHGFHRGRGGSSVGVPPHGVVGVDFGSADVPQTSAVSRTAPATCRPPKGLWVSVQLGEGAGAAGTTASSTTACGTSTGGFPFSIRSTTGAIASYIRRDSSSIERSAPGPPLMSRSSTLR